MAKKNKHALSEVEGVVESQDNPQTPFVKGDLESAVPNPEPRATNLRYVGKTIKHFEHGGKTYQLMPNSVYLNLPADAEQVKRLIAAGELKEV